MSDSILRGMARSGWACGLSVLQNHLECFPEEEAKEMRKMSFALRWLAENVTNEMVEEAIDDLDPFVSKSSIRLVLLKASESGE